MPNSPTVDTRPLNPRACCILCATWVCHECWNFHRQLASRRTQQVCGNCGGIEGEFTATRHTDRGNHLRVFPYWRAVPLRPIPHKSEINEIYFYAW